MIHLTAVAALAAAETADAKHSFDRTKLPPMVETEASMFMHRGLPSEENRAHLATDVAEQISPKGTRRLQDKFQPTIVANHTESGPWATAKLTPAPTHNVSTGTFVLPPTNRTLYYPECTEGGYPSDAGDGWVFVRKTADIGKRWHPARDHLAGTSVYREGSNGHDECSIWYPDACSIRFEDAVPQYDQILLSNGDCTTWMQFPKVNLGADRIARRSPHEKQWNGGVGAWRARDFAVRKSWETDELYVTHKIHFREGHKHDPIINASRDGEWNDHIIYAGDSWTRYTGAIGKHHFGGYVWVRRKNHPRM